MNRLLSYKHIKGSRIILGSLFFLSACYGQLTLAGKINPHGTNQCILCHSETGEPSADNFNPDACDACHSRNTVNQMIHQLDNINIRGRGVDVPENFKLSSAEKFDCTSCHEISCRKNRTNQTFLRGGPYKSELDFCFTCHKSEAFQKLNPHLQLRADGSIDKSTCLHCHLTTPDVGMVTKKNKYLQLDMTPTCNKCHALHRHENQHLGKSIDTDARQIRNTLIATEKQFKIHFPLSANQEIQCATCHYTHPRGVLKTEDVIFAGFKENQWLLRLPKEKLCLACHDI